MRICFVSNELSEFHQNGGIGTATSGLIVAMAEAGHEVEVLYTGFVRSEDGYSFRNADIHAGYERLRSKGIQVFFIEDHFEKRFTQDLRRLSYSVFWFLKGKHFDIIHFNDYGGNGYYATLARRTGCGFERTQIVTTIHGPSLWAMELDEEPISHAGHLEQGFLEHKAIEGSDGVVGVSQSLLDWLRDRGVVLPQNTRLLKNIHPDLPRLKASGALSPRGLREVAFFGRMDERKGLALFIEAVTRFSRDYPDIIISFYGKFSRLRGEHSAGYVLHRLASVPNPIRFRTRFSRDEALRALCRPGVLAIIPSKSENSPCVVVECQTLGIPFLASNVGGIPELVRPEDREQVLVAPNVASLAGRLAQVAIYGVEAAPPLRSRSEIATDWLRLFEELAVFEPIAAVTEAEASPLVSICITHYRRPQYLRRLLAAIEAQTYPSIEVILVDDGSDDPAVDQELTSLSQTRFRFLLKIVQIRNSYLGAARNHAAEQANGTFLKFQDDDNLPLPHEVETLVRAAERTGVDVVTCFAYQMTGAEPKPIVDNRDIHYFPLGEALTLGQLRNEFGDANALVRRSAFVALGGFTELRDVGQEDHEFFARCVSTGRHLIVVPEPLFHYRVQLNSMLQTGSVYDGFIRAARGFEEIDKHYLRELAQILVGQRLREEINTVGWHRAGTHAHGWLHHQLLEYQANDSITIDRVVDLMGHYGRVEDALFLSMDHRPVHQALEWMSTLGEVKIAEREDDMFGGVRPPRVKRLGESTAWELIAPRRGELPKHWNPDWELVKPEYGGILIHPVGEETTIVRIIDAVPRGTTRVTVRWFHANPSGGPARIAAATTMAHDVELGRWSQLFASDGSVDLVLDVEPVNFIQDLILMTRAIADDKDVWPVARLLMIESQRELLDKS